MATLKLIVILGPDMVNPLSAFERLKLEAQGVKFIGDGKSPVNYEQALKDLSTSKEIGPDTVIYVNARGSVQGGAHNLLLAGAKSTDATVSTVFLETVQNAVTAYARGGNLLSPLKQTPWNGSIVIESSFSGQIYEDLQKPGAINLNRTLLCSANADMMSYGGLSDVSRLLTYTNNLYTFVLKDTKITNSWTIKGPNVPGRGHGHGDRGPGAGGLGA